MHNLLTVVAALGIVSVGGYGAYRHGQDTARTEHHGRHRHGARRPQMAEVA